MNSLDYFLLKFIYIWFKSLDYLYAFFCFWVVALDDSERGQETQRIIYNKTLTFFNKMLSHLNNQVLLFFCPKSDSKR